MSAIQASLNLGDGGVLCIKELLYLHQINLILVVLSILLLSFARTSNSLRYHNSKDKLTWQATALIQKSLRIQGQ